MPAGSVPLCRRCSLGLLRRYVDVVAAVRLDYLPGNLGKMLSKVNASGFSFRCAVGIDINVGIGPLAPGRFHKPVSRLPFHGYAERYSESFGRYLSRLPVVSRGVVSLPMLPKGIYQQFCRINPMFFQRPNIPH